MDELILKHRGKVCEGKLHFSNLSLYQANIDELEGKEFEIQLIERVTDVTKNQHNYYNGIILPYALKHESFGGWTKQELDKALKTMFLKEEKTKELNGIPMKVTHIPSKAGIGKNKMKKYISLVIVFLAKQGVVVPEEYDPTKKYADRNKIKTRNS